MTVEYTTLPGGGWMASCYWGTDKKPFDADNVTTVPVLAWRIRNDLPDDEDEDPSTWATPIWQGDPGSSTVDGSEGPTALSVVIWHPDSSGDKWRPVDHSSAVRTLDDRHHWWPVERMTIVAAKTCDDYRGRGWEFTVRNEFGDRAGIGWCGDREYGLGPAKLAALGVPQDAQPKLANYNVGTVARYRQQVLALSPDVFIGLETWGQFKDGERSVVGLYPPDSPYDDSHLR